MPKALISRTRLQTLVEAPEGARTRIAIIGDAMLDIYLRGDVERISPEAPVPVVLVRERRQALGGAANVAQNAVALGARAELVAALGSDASGGQFRTMFQLLGADPRGLITTERPTTTKTRIVARGQQVVRVDEEVDGDLEGTEVEALIAAVDLAVSEADALVLEDYNKGVLIEPVIRRAVGAAKKRGIPIVVDPKYRNFFAYGGATVFKPNRRELDSALGATVDLEHPEALPAVLKRLGAERLLLTLSEHGMALIEPDGVIHRIPTTAREVFDVVGAGDTVTAWLAAMLAVGATHLEAAVIANYAAGVEVGKTGAATVSPAEILAAYDAS
jgi:D-beta-D-heptose 7-phosphate kinase/D-beta-D-heptose 1-phosphate adenosyltransferase